MGLGETTYWATRETGEVGERTAARQGRVPNALTAHGLKRAVSHQMPSATLPTAPDSVPRSLIAPPLHKVARPLKETMGKLAAIPFSNGGPK
jgi:hypothetical protein